IFSIGLNKTFTNKTNATSSPELKLPLKLNQAPNTKTSKVINRINKYILDKTSAITLYAVNFVFLKVLLFSTKRLFSYDSFVNDCTTLAPVTASSIRALIPAIFSYIFRQALLIMIFPYVINKTKNGIVNN